jgi:hypothetical protein
VWVWRVVWASWWLAGDDDGMFGRGRRSRYSISVLGQVPARIAGCLNTSCLLLDQMYNSDLYLLLAYVHGNHFVCC